MKKTSKLVYSNTVSITLYIYRIYEHSRMREWNYVGLFIEKMIVHINNQKYDNIITYLVCNITLSVLKIEYLKINITKRSFLIFLRIWTTKRSHVNYKSVHLQYFTGLAHACFSVSTCYGDPIISSITSMQFYPHWRAYFLFPIWECTISVTFS